MRNLSAFFAAVLLASTLVAAAPAGDRSSTDRVLDAAYQSISGPAGAQRDWGRFRAVAAPDARFILVTRDPTGAVNVQSMNIDQFIQGFTEFLNGRAFYERDVYRHSEGFGDVATVLSTYESREDPRGKAVARGLNSFQLVKTGDGWRIQTIFWEDENPSASLPAKYRGTGR